ncbi:histidine phosphatase family protein [Endozoicomonas arenosclerae]|uniref:histidine phosphatase family protein n=1 Tax=Endozoicomonas arenosclerae TaxID=1633495 RepID=UPI00078407E5|nr:histidine phosphatase family protein [Endozoicomonas arenosclerae]
MKTLYVISHTEATHHLEGVVGGWYDSVLTEKGLEDARAIGSKLLAEGAVGDIHTSDLKRAAQTAEVIAGITGGQLNITSDLREKSFGVAEGKPQAWLDERIVPEDGLNRLDHRIIEGSETTREFASRIYGYMDSISLGDTTVISTHAFAATFVIAWWIGMSLESIGYVNFNIKSGKISKLVEDDFFKNRNVAYLNH